MAKASIALAELVEKGAKVADDNYLGRPASIMLAGRGAG